MEKTKGESRMTVRPGEPNSLLRNSRCETSTVTSHPPLWLDGLDVSCETTTLPPCTPQWVESADESSETITLPPFSPRSEYDARACDQPEKNDSDDAHLARLEHVEDERVSKLLARLDTLEEDALRRSLQLLEPFKRHHDGAPEGVIRSISARLPSDGRQGVASTAVAFMATRSYSARQLGATVSCRYGSDSGVCALAHMKKSERRDTFPFVLVAGDTMGWSQAPVLRKRSSPRKPIAQLCPHLVPSLAALAPLQGHSLQSSSPSAPTPHEAPAPRVPSPTLPTEKASPKHVHALTPLSPRHHNSCPLARNPHEAFPVQSSRWVGDHPNPRILTTAQPRRCGAVHQRVHCAGGSTPRPPAPSYLCSHLAPQSWDSAPNACVQGKHSVYRPACMQWSAAAVVCGSVLSARKVRFC